MIPADKIKAEIDRAARVIRTAEEFYTSPDNWKRVCKSSKLMADYKLFLKDKAEIKALVRQLQAAVNRGKA